MCGIGFQPDIDDKPDDVENDCWVDLCQIGTDSSSTFLRSFLEPSDHAFPDADDNCAARICTTRDPMEILTDTRLRFDEFDITDKCFVCVGIEDKEPIEPPEAGVCQKTAMCDSATGLFTWENYGPGEPANGLQCKVCDGEGGVEPGLGGTVCDDGRGDSCRVGICGGGVCTSIFDPTLPGCEEQQCDAKSDEPCCDDPDPDPTGELLNYHHPLMVHIQKFPPKYTREEVDGQTHHTVEWEDAIPVLVKGAPMFLPPGGTEPFREMAAGVNNYWNQTFCKGQETYTLKFSVREISPLDPLADKQSKIINLEGHIGRIPGSTDASGTADQGCGDGFQPCTMKIILGKHVSVAGHEFGHILGFGDAYDTENDAHPVFAGHEEDIMSNLSDVDVHLYHARILVDLYRP